MKHILLVVVVLAAFSMHGFAQKVDTLIRSVKPNLDIPGNSAYTQAVAFPGHTLPYFSTLLDVDLYLDVSHDDINSMAITLVAPVSFASTVMPIYSCYGQPVQSPQDIKVTLNDQAYDIHFYNQTGIKIPATYTCTTAIPSLGSYNNGHMQTSAYLLEKFNTTDWILGGQCGVTHGFTANMTDINATTNRLSSLEILDFIVKMGIQPGNRILLTYKKAQGEVLTGLKLNQVCLFDVLNNHTLELVNGSGSDITAVPPGSTHEFVFQRDWLLLFHNFNSNSKRRINEVALKLAVVNEPCTNPKSADDMEDLLPEYEAETRDDLDVAPFIAYPNPFNDILTIAVTAEGIEGQLSIRGMDGRLVYGPVYGASLREVSTSAWPGGMYMAEWRDVKENRQVLVVKK